MTQIVCQECDAQLTGLAVDFSSGQPLCRNCGAVVVGGREGGRLSVQLKAKVQVPASIQVQQVPDGTPNGALRIKVPWRIQSAPALTQLTYVWIVGGLAFMLAQLELGWIVILLLPSVVAAILFAIRMVNGTVLTVGSGRIRIAHSPLPWLSTTVDAGTIEQLYVDRRPLAQKRFDYSVRARVVDQDDPVLLFRSLADPIVALYLEQCIEQVLQIEDAPVSGEFRAEHMHAVQQHAYAKPSNPAMASGPHPQPPVPPQYPSGWPPQQ